LFVTAPEEDEHPMGNGDGAWGKTTVSGWGPTNDTSPNMDSGWGSGDGDADKGGNEGTWGAPADGVTKKDSQGWGNGGGDDTRSVGSDDIDIIIQENGSKPQVAAEFAADGTDLLGDQTEKLHIEPTATPSSPQVDPSGWDIPDPVPAPARASAKVPAQAQVGQLGRGYEYIVAKTRRRITDDGGKSILATDQF
jgi:hypothetical protein